VSALASNDNTAFEEGGKDGDAFGFLENGAGQRLIGRAHDFVENGRGLGDPFRFVGLSQDHQRKSYGEYQCGE
jgi:hypothetical protein